MDTNKSIEQNNFVQERPINSYELEVPKNPCTKKRIRRVADPHIEPYHTGGRLYYRYRCGERRPVHLGSADSILADVMAAKRKDNRV